MNYLAGDAERVELKGCGGAVLQPLFSDIAFNFLSKDPETEGYLRRFFKLENSFLVRGEITHDFVVGV